jgi:large subunit ribosomal protein L10
MAGPNDRLGWNGNRVKRRDGRCSSRQHGEAEVDRAEKQELITKLNVLFQDTGVLVVAHYAGMTVAQMTDLRRRMREAGGHVKVAKNRLIKLALQGTPASGIADLFVGPTCMAYSKDPIAAAKVAVAYAKTNDKLIIIGGTMGTTKLDAKGIKALAELPSLDELRARIVGVINAPASKLVRTINEPGAALARVLQAHADKGGAGGDPGEGGEKAA